MPANRVSFSAENSGTGLYHFRLYSGTGLYFLGLFSGTGQIVVKNQRKTLEISLRLFSYSIDFSGTFPVLTLIHMGFFRATIYGGGGVLSTPPSENYLRLLRIQYNLAQLQIKLFLACSVTWVWLPHLMTSQ